MTCTTFRTRRLAPCMDSNACFHHEFTVSIRSREPHNSRTYSIIMPGSLACIGGFLLPAATQRLVELHHAQQFEARTIFHPTQRRFRQTPADYNNTCDAEQEAVVRVNNTDTFQEFIKRLICISPLQSCPFRTRDGISLRDIMERVRFPGRLDIALQGIGLLGLPSETLSDLQLELPARRRAGRDGGRSGIRSQTRGDH